jgi:CRP-like cAMP-binding protein
MDNSEELEKLLQAHPFFADMGLKVCATLADCAHSEQFREGDYIFREGTPANRLYLILQGGVALEAHVPGREPIIIDTLEDGEVLGVSWLVAPYKWAYDARATRATRLIAMSAACLRGKYDNDPALAYELFQRYIPIMADRLAATRRKIIEKAQASRRKHEEKSHGAKRGI